MSDTDNQGFEHEEWCWVLRPLGRPGTGCDCAAPPVERTSDICCPAQEGHPNRERAMVVVAEGVWCDPCLVPLIDALNSGGVPTVASCCGHGKRPGSIALTDGRWLLVTTQNQFDQISDYIHNQGGPADV